jgi:hypothetical protein
LSSIPRIRRRAALDRDPQSSHARARSEQRRNVSTSSTSNDLILDQVSFDQPGLKPRYLPPGRYRIRQRGADPADDVE